MKLDITLNMGTGPSGSLNYTFEQTDPKEPVYVNRETGDIGLPEQPATRPFEVVAINFTIAEKMFIDGVEYTANFHERSALQIREVTSAGWPKGFASPTFDASNRTVGTVVTEPLCMKCDFKYTLDLVGVDAAGNKLRIILDPHIRNGGSGISNTGPVPDGFGGLGSFALFVFGAMLGYGLRWWQKR